MSDNNLQFSAAHRSQLLSTLTSQTFDLVVIGGGITGAGIALDAITRGLSVALIEKQDFAAGTSSRSTKLIHGGLRYLKQLEFGLVREVGLERDIVYNNAPHLVIPEKMMLPVIKGGSLSRFSTSVAIYVYDWLAGVKWSERRKMFSKEETLRMEPLLNKDLVLGSAIYTEYRSDDARLVIETLKEAVNRGALAINYTECTGFVYQNGKINGLTAKETFSNRSFEIKGKFVVNASGPWVDTLREADNSLKGKRLHLTKGVHLVFKHERFAVKQAMYFDAPEGRMIFAIPRDGCTYLGTTDTNYSGNKERPRVNEKDVNYLLTAANNLFPELKLNSSDIISTWAGLRPLIHEDGKSASELSRKDEIFESETGLISIAGGKLTGYRKMAERIVNLVCVKLGNLKSPCVTKRIKLGGGFLDAAEVKRFSEYLWGISRQIQVEKPQIERLVRLYGKNAELIVNRAYDFHRQSPNLSSLNQAEWWYAVHFEMVCLPSDYFVRRTGMLYFNPKEINQHATEASKSILSQSKVEYSLEKALQELNEEQIQSLGFTS